MEWVDKLNKSIKYIENNLRGEISYDEITRICCCTLPKFQQIFSITCGIPVSEYIRNRRMTIAAYEEYFRASMQIQVYGGKFKMGIKGIMRIETERLVIRKFQAEDWKDLQELAISNTNSEFGDCDEQWPLDDDGIKGACNYFASENQFWAVEVKDLKKVVSFINFNGINENQNLNIGHIINSEYLGNDYEYEALKALYNYGFLELGALEVSATWTLADKKKLEPLEKLGMKVVRTFMANKFKPNPDGTTSHFESCNLVVTREEWISNPAV